MIQFRPFRNNDTPALVEIWRSQPAARGLVQPITTSIFERYVFSRLYFDRQGLIVADDEGQLIGFVHAGFGPNGDRSWAGCETGIISMLQVLATHGQRDELALQLLRLGEQYLRQRGAQSIFGGEFDFQSPFYFGLYGGSQLPGVLESDAWRRQLFERAGYRAAAKFVVLHCRLADFRAIVNRQQMTIRRRTRLEMVLDPRTTNWWDANLSSQHDFTSFRLLANDSQQVWAAATFWDMEPLASSWGIHAAGLVNCELMSSCTEKGADAFLLTESFKHLQSNGVTLIETQAREQDTARLQLMTELGFQRVDAGVVFAIT